jgi:hypothetical protein
MPEQTTATTMAKCKCGRTVLFPDDPYPWCEGCNQYVAYCDCIPLPAPSPQPPTLAEPQPSTCRHTFQTWHCRNLVCDECGADSRSIHDVEPQPSGAAMRYHKVDDERLRETESLAMHNDSVASYRVLELLADRAEMQDRYAAVVANLDWTKNENGQAMTEMAKVIADQQEDAARLRTENAALVAELAGVRKPAPPMVEVQCERCEGHCGWWGENDGEWYECLMCDGVGWIIRPGAADEGK